MHRTTIALPESTTMILKREARRRNVSASALAREAIEAHLGIGQGKRELPFANLGASGHTDTAERIEEILAEEWTDPRRS